MFHSKLKETLNHSIAKVTSDRDSFVSHPEKDFCVSENSLRSRLFSANFKMTAILLSADLRDINLSNS